MNHAGEILILTGTPGAGKTTAAEALAAEPGAPKVHLHADDFWHVIRNGAIPPYLPEAHAQNEVVINVLVKAAETFAAGGFFVIVDGIIGPWFLSPFRTILAPLHYIVLRPPLAVAIKRCRERGGDTLTDPAHITTLHQQLAGLHELERHVLPTDGLDRAETLRRIIDTVASGACRLSA